MTVVVGVPGDFTPEAFRRVAVDGESVVIGAAAVEHLRGRPVGQFHSARSLPAQLGTLPAVG